MQGSSSPSPLPKLTENFVASVPQEVDIQVSFFSFFSVSHPVRPHSKKKNANKQESREYFRSAKVVLPRQGHITPSSAIS
jgi:hypothetical protein